MSGPSTEKYKKVRKLREGDKIIANIDGKEMVGEIIDIYANSRSSSAPIMFKVYFEENGNTYKMSDVWINSDADIYQS